MTNKSDEYTWGEWLQYREKVLDKEYDFKALVGMSIGEASLCWSHTPEGVFQSVRAKQIMNKLIEAHEKELTLLKQINEKMEECLKFYSDEKQSRTDDNDHKYVGNDGLEDRFILIRGKRARQCLKEIEEMGK